MPETLPKPADAKPALPVAAVKEKQSGDRRSLGRRLWYDLLQYGCRMTALLAFQVRCFGTEHLPASGNALICSNHQSHLDPPLIGLASRRRLCYLARNTLFNFPPLRWLIQSLQAIPIDRDGFGLSGIKETLRRLKKGEAVLLFPEGTRSADGEFQPLKPGLCSLARRSRSPIVPVGIAGAFDAWPRQNRLPGSGVIHIHFGQPLQVAEIAAMDDEALLAEIDRRIRACVRGANGTRARSKRRVFGAGGSTASPLQVDV